METNWPENIDQARKLQERDNKLVRAVAFEGEPAFIAGVDAAFDEESVYAAACLYHYPALTPIEKTAATGKRAFPYVPGYLLFLEGPAIMSALGRLRTRPDIVLVDGQGIAHPRGIGSAAHLGVLLDIPTIGCAKTRLVGTCREPGRQKGSWSELIYEGRRVGAVVRTRDGVRPLFVSPGHRMDLASAVEMVLRCVGRFRIPEPLRCADILSRRLKTEQGTSSAILPSD